MLAEATANLLTMSRLTALEIRRPRMVKAPAAPTGRDPSTSRILPVLVPLQRPAQLEKVIGKAPDYLRVR